jgi:predicted GIY-YIG superfamily endonuclease
MHATIPTVYLLHFARPLGNLANNRAQASHYLGYAVDLDARLRQHRAGQGAAITRAAVDRGIAFELVASWPGDYLLERRLKALKATPRLCPICGRRHPGGRLHVPVQWLQLELPWAEFDPFRVPARRADYYEIAQERRWREARALPVGQFDGQVDDCGIAF